MAQLIAKYNDRGELTRLVLKPNGVLETRLAVGIIGASTTDDKTDITFHAEPLIVDDLRLNLGDDRLQISDDVRNWREHFQRRATTALRVARRVDVDPSLRWPVMSAIDYANQLYPFQRVGAEWLSFVGRGILADDLGLGKTIQAMTAAARYRTGRVLIVTLSGIKPHWYRHIKRWLPDVDVGLTGGNRAERQRVIDEGHDWLIINHEMLRQGQYGYDRLFDCNWDAAIFDEAHLFQGRNSQQSAGAEELRFTELYELTGTPVWNRPDSLWHLLHLLEPYRWSSYWRFVEEYCDTRTTPYSTSVVGVKQSEADRLRSVLAPMLLRREKKDVAPWLPPKVYKTIEWEPSKKQLAAYRTMKKKYRLDADGVTLQVYRTMPLAQMRLLLDSPKLLGIDWPSPKDQLLLETLNAVLSEGRKAIVFCYYPAYADYLSQLFQSRGYRNLVSHGGVAQDERDSRIETFKRSSSIHVLIVTIATAGTGLDIPEAGAAIFAEGDYVPTRNAQAEDRLHRIVGTKISPLIYRVQAPNTVEDHIWQMADDRKEMSEQMLAFRELVSRVNS